MKNIYYGIKQTIYPTDNYSYFSNLRTFCHEIGWLWERGDSIFNLRKESLEKDLERLRNGVRVYSYILDQKRVDSNEVFILEKEHNHENGIGEEVEIGKYRGKINERRYDANTNTMHYYTDVIVISNNVDNYDELYSNKIKEVTGALEELYEKYFKSIKENKKEEFIIVPIEKPLKKWYQFWK